MTAVDADPGQPELHSFTTGIRQDEQAVRNGLTLPWSSGLVEGLNTRTKLIKRQMYGRAGFPLLRKRILGMMTRAEGAVCKTAGSAYAGSNPTPATLFSQVKAGVAGW